MPTLNDQMKSFVAAAHKAAREHSLVRCSSGNLSWRLPDGSVLISATGSWLEDLTVEQVAHVQLDGTPLNDRKPTSESRFHLGILRQRPETNVVFHFQSAAATAIACTESRSWNFDVVPEIPVYIGRIGIVPYLLPGSAELADAVIDCMTKHTLCILRNHGLVTIGRDFGEAIQRAAFFELACDILLRARERLSPLPLSAADSLRANGYKAPSK